MEQLNEVCKKLPKKNQKKTSFPCTEREYIQEDLRRGKEASDIGDLMLKAKINPKNRELILELKRRVDAYPKIAMYDDPRWDYEGSGRDERKKSKVSPPKINTKSKVESTSYPPDPFIVKLLADKANKMKQREERLAKWNKTLS